MIPFCLNIKGELRRFTRPQVMGIVNVTPDSFYAPSRKETDDAVSRRVIRILEEGATMIDVGAYSSRPGADDVDESTEIERLRRSLPIVRSLCGNAIVSVDTFRSHVARVAVEELGADIVNDISGGTLDNGMFDTVARMKVPYILMHMRGTPATMKSLTDYSAWGGSASAGVVGELSYAIRKLEQLGVADIIIDPGFGFAKTIGQNYDILRNLAEIGRLLGDRPILAGLSRKSMFWKAMDLTPEEVLPATIAANTIALTNGAAILRVHDVAEAVQTVKVVELTTSPDSQTAITNNINHSN